MNRAFLGDGESLTNRTGRLAVLALAVVISVLTLVLVGLRDGAGANQSRAVKTVVLGQSGNMPDPACPQTCQVVASVNGFQVRAPSSNTPFRVPFNGKLTQFTLYLGEPSNRDRRALNDRFGSPPQAAITVLKKFKTSGGKDKFRLLRKSPVEGLSQELGTTARFRLDKALNVRKGNFVALSVPTWAPVFALGLNSDSNRWRASRQPGKCSSAFIDQAAPQLKVDSRRFYGCTFRGSRLLYTATITNG